MNPNIQSYTAWCLSPTHHELISPTTQHHHVPRCAAFLPLDARFRQGHLWRLNCPSHPPQALIKQPPFNYIYFLSSPGPMLQNPMFFPDTIQPFFCHRGLVKDLKLDDNKNVKSKNKGGKNKGNGDASRRGKGSKSKSKGSSGSKVDKPKERKSKGAPSKKKKVPRTPATDESAPAADQPSPAKKSRKSKAKA